MNELLKNFAKETYNQFIKHGLEYSLPIILTIGSIDVSIVLQEFNLSKIKDYKYKNEFIITESILHTQSEEQNTSQIKDTEGSVYITGTDLGIF
ncbi:MAG: hypothetical protein ABSG15_04630 [FCB group bacterium]|jgi:hypothetical protein